MFAPTPNPHLQTARNWTLSSGELVSSNVLVRALHDTTDAELLRMDAGVGGSLRGGTAEPDVLLGAARCATAL